MDEELCTKELFENEITINKIESCMRLVLKKVQMSEYRGKIIMKYKGEKVGYLLLDAPIDEINVYHYWSGPFGIKTELSYKGKFIGVLLIRK